MRPISSSVSPRFSPLSSVPLPFELLRSASSSAKLQFHSFTNIRSFLLTLYIHFIDRVMFWPMEFYMGIWNSPHTRHIMPCTSHHTPGNTYLAFSSDAVLFTKRVWASSSKLCWAWYQLNYFQFKIELGLISTQLLPVQNWVGLDINSITSSSKLSWAWYQTQLLPVQNWVGLGINSITSSSKLSWAWYQLNYFQFKIELGLEPGSLWCLLVTSLYSVAYN